ncbi:MAG: DUF937 domain-containing protein [Pseudomonadota bacterium]
MNGLLDLIGSHLNDDALSAMSAQSGAPREKLDAAVPAALSMLTAGLSNNAQGGGASALLGALDRDHDGSILDDLPALLGGGAAQSQGAGILGHVLGSRQDMAAQGVAKASGLDIGSAGNLLAMLAPVVMGALGKQRREASVDEGGLADLLRGERARADNDMGLSGLTRMLDMDGDGSVLDEITEIGGGLLGGLLGGRR